MALQRPIPTPTRLRGVASKLYFSPPVRALRMLDGRRKLKRTGGEIAPGRAPPSGACKVMRRLLLSIAVAIWVIILTFPAQAVSHAAGKTNSRMQIIEGPTLESATGSSAIIRWKTNTGSSPIEHSVVHYGTGPRDLSKKEEFPIRLN